MQAVNPYAKVADNNVLTASADELTLMLYEGAIKFCNQAIAAIEKKDINKAHTLIIRVQDIIREFQMSLDNNYEISENFHDLYEYMHRRMVDANYDKDVEIIQEVAGLFREFRDVWKEAMKIARKENPAS